jgi:hypothetical protein
MRQAAGNAMSVLAILLYSRKPRWRRNRRARLTMAGGDAGSSFRANKVPVRVVFEAVCQQYR